jgi:hydroxyethylthiazole kinase-like uncharacterized protein yjeF
VNTAKNDGWIDVTRTDAAGSIRLPAPHDDKYSRGVLGVVTGSATYPGAAVLGVEAAARTGVGMLRYRGPGRATRLVLQRRPEVVTTAGRVQAWLLGSGIDTAQRPAEVTEELEAALAEGLPTVVDAGALDLVSREAGAAALAHVVITPHAGELAGLWTRSGRETSRQEIVAAPADWAVRSAERFGVTVLLKGHTTLVASPGGERLRVTASSSWSATAGSGDVLGGIVGALLAARSDAVASASGGFTIAGVAAAGAFLHQAAGALASGGGPVTALDIAEAVPAIIRSLVAVVPLVE